MQKIIDSFLSPFKDKRIAVYGTGINAERVICSVEGYDFVCMLSNDAAVIGTEFFGKKVKGLRDALSDIDIILIAAIPSATRIVYERIKREVPDHIMIYDLSGNQLNAPLYYTKHDYWNKSYDDLIMAIDDHDVISFDVFDTLLMRKVLYPTTVQKVLAMDNSTFFAERKEAENSFYKQGRQPKLSDVYELLGNNKSLMNKEIELELSFCKRRETVCDAYQYALSNNKKVYLVSDMYLSKDTIGDMLKAQAITGYEELLVSCEEGCSKTNGLFEVLKERTGQGRILHIGNDKDTDIIAAQRYGIDTFHIWSGLDAALNSSVAQIISSVNSTWDEVLLGYIMSDLKVFNDPFEMCKTKGKLRINSIEMLTKLCFIPITMAYIAWIVRQLQAHSDDVVLFVSRDGYLLEKLYREVRDNNPDLELPKSIYFLASRRAMSEAVASTTKDIEVLCSNIDQYRKEDIVHHLEKIFGMPLGNHLQKYRGKRFEELSRDELMSDLIGIKDVLFDHSSGKRSGYLKYIETLGFEKYHNIYMVDLVAQGSSRYGLSSMCCRVVKLLTMGTTKIPNAFVEDPGLMNSMYGELITGVGGAISTMFNLLELIYGSSDGQLTGFDGNGNPKYDDSTKYNLRLLDAVQDRIISFVSDYFDDKWYLREYSNEFAESMLGILSAEHSEVSEEVRSLFDFYDPLDEETARYNVLDRVRGDS